jgi:hypothetical protein
MNIIFSEQLPTEEGNYIVKHLNHIEGVRVRYDYSREQLVVDICGNDQDCAEELFRYNPEHTPRRWSQKLSAE